MKSMVLKKVKFRLTIVRLVFVPITSFILIGVLSNGIRELLSPEWQILKDIPILIPIIAWIELIIIAFLCIISIYCLIVLYYVLTKYVSVDKLEEALDALKKRED